MLRSAIGASLLCSALLGLAACGDSEDPSPSADAGGDEEASEAQDNETIKIRFAAFTSEAGPYGVATKQWMDLVEEKTPNYDMEFETFFDASLLGPTEVLAGLREDRVDAVTVSAPYTPAELPLSQMGGVPFISDNGDAVARAAAEIYESNDAFRAEWESHNAMPLVWAIVDSNLIGFSDPVSSVEDMKGRRVRAVGLVGEALRARGMEPTALPAPEVYESVQRGVVDGWSSMPLDNGVLDFKLHEVGPNIVDPGTGVIALVSIVVVNLETFESLPEEVQQAMREAGAEMADFVQTTVEGLMQDACDVVEEAGASIYLVPEDERAAWAEEVRDPSIETWKQQAVEAGIDEADAEEFLDDYLAAVESHEGSSTYSSGAEACAERLG